MGVVVSSGSHDNFCRDLTDYGKLYYTKINVTVCEISLEKQCKNEPVSMCMEVPEIDCQVGLKLWIGSHSVCRLSSSPSAHPAKWRIRCKSPSL